ncbi:MAG TPA: hydroxysqualene dehydroxylase HpnE [Candidatus Binataceae bacterium]|nr:hydroxysqualene dehydroxylase HpnE [Candidatus Binataceae bacterium]
MGGIALAQGDGLIYVAVEAKDVVVIGGGFAGLSAGVALAERGFRVALLEAKPALGGRAYSFADSESEDFVDNGQHVLLGCYRETLDFLGRIGMRDRLIVHRNLEIEMLDGPGSRALLRAAPLPGPLHMAAGILGYRHLTPGQRLGVVRAGTRLMYLRRLDRRRLARMSVAELMDSTRQSERARKCFWEPLAIATLNEDPELASAALLAEVMKRAFFSRRRDSAFVYSTVGLSDLYCGAARAFIEKRDGVVANHSIVDGFDLEAGGSIAAARLRDGRRLRAASFIAAVPPHQLLKMLPEGLISEPFFAPIGSLKSSPIICVHVWLDREVTRSAFVGFIGTTTQWLFNKRRIFSQHGARHPGYLSFVISGARKLVDEPNEELLDLVMNDLRSMIPAARQARIVRALVLKEKHATIAPDADSDVNRPPTATPVPNLFLAGDWIQTGLPATIESAVASGNAAARAVAARVDLWN